MRQGVTLTGFEKVFWEEIFTLSLEGESVRPRNGKEVGMARVPGRENSPC